MKLIKIVKCQMCGKPPGRNGLHCRSVMTNGCDAHFCLIPCWQTHAKIHDVEWQKMTATEREALIQERHDNG